MNLSKLFGRARRAATLLEDLFSGAPSVDPLDEDPHYILTHRERASIRDRRADIADPLLRADVTQLLDAVERMGDRQRISAHLATVPSAPKPSLLTWLAEPWPMPLPWPAAMDPLVLVSGVPTRLQVFAALVAMNGGMKIERFGTYADGGPYGRMGLSADEMVVLVHVNAFVLGWKTATGERTEDVERAIAREIERASVLRAEMMHAKEELPPVKIMRVAATELYVNGEKVAATELYVNGEKVADVSDVRMSAPQDGARIMCGRCQREHFPRDPCQA